MKIDKTNSNLFANYDASATEANQDIINNIQVKTVIKDAKKNQELKKAGELIKEINKNNDNNQNLNQFLKTDKEKKVYKTIYINGDYIKKIKKLSELTNRSFGEIIELSIDEFIKNQNINI